MGFFSLTDSLEGRKQQGGLIFIGINLHLLGSWVKASPKFLLGGTLLGFFGMVPLVSWPRAPKRRENP